MSYCSWCISNLLTFLTFCGNSDSTLSCDLAFWVSRVGCQISSAPMSDDEKPAVGSNLVEEIKVYFKTVSWFKYLYIICMP